MQSRRVSTTKRWAIPIVILLLASAMLSSCANSKTVSLPRVIGKQDQLCNSGKGLHFSPSFGVLGSGATSSSTSGLSLVPANVVETKDGRTLLSFYPMDAAFDNGPVRTVSATSRCTIDRSFGNHGFLEPSVSGASTPLTSYGLAQGRGGNFFVTSSKGQAWLVGEFTSNGNVDVNFGDRGWVTITLPGGASGFEAGVTDLQVTRNGDVLLLGGNAQSHSLVQPYLYELNPNGSINTSFGDSGHVALFSTFVYAGSLLLQPDGMIVATGQYGGAGCYSMPFEWVSPSGYVQSTIDAKFNASRPTAVTSQEFWGSIFLDPLGGVGIVGLAKTCNGSPSSASSEIQEFGPNGSPLHSFGRDGTVKISTPNPNDFDFSATVLTDHDLVVESYENESSSVVSIRDFQENGRPVEKFGLHGIMKLKDPSLLTTYSAPSAVATVTQGDLGLVVPYNNGLTFEEIVG